MLAIDFYYNWWLLKEPFLGIWQLFARSFSLAGDNYWQHTLQMSDVSGTFFCVYSFLPEPCDSVHELVLGMGLHSVPYEML